MARVDYFRDMPQLQIVQDTPKSTPFSHREALRAIFGDGPVGTDPEHRKRCEGEALVLMTERMGYTYVQAYRLARPSSTVQDSGARTAVHKIKKWYHRTYPMGILDALGKHGVTIDRLVGVLEEGLTANRVRWDPDKGEYVETNIPDRAERRRTAEALLKVGNLDIKARQELAVGKAEMAKMQLNTGRKFETIKEWTEWMEGQHEVTIAERTQAAKDMRLISAGRQIIQEEGQEAADKMKLIAMGQRIINEQGQEAADRMRLTAIGRGLA